MSFLELVADPTTSGRAKDLRIWSAMESPPPMLEIVLDAEDAVFSNKRRDGV